MHTAAESAWEQLCQVVQGTASEEELVLMTLNELRDLMAVQGFTPLTAARAEVQWQVLQATNPMARRREYEDSIKGSPQRSPGSRQHHSIAQSPHDATTASHHPTPDIAKLKKTASPRTNSPRRELGSREGVLSPRSLRPPRTPSPSAMYGPVAHERPFEIPHAVRGPHMSRRRNMSPRSALAEVHLPQSTPRSPRARGGVAASCNPNDLSPTVPRTTGLQTIHRSGPAQCDPNTTSLSQQDPTLPSIRQMNARDAGQDLFAGPVENVSTKTRYLPQDRVAALSDPNNVASQPTAYRGKALVHAEAPSSCNPNNTASAPDANFLARKHRTDKGATTEEVVPRFTPLPGPPENGVFPGSHAWMHSLVPGRSEGGQKRVIPHDKCGASNPNEVAPMDLKFIGGKSQVRGPEEQGVGTALFGRDAERVAVASQGGATIDPNTLSPEPAAFRTGLSSVSGVPDTWGGPAGISAKHDVKDAKASKPTKRGTSIGAYHPHGCADYSHKCYSHRKAEHLVQPARFTSSPRARKADFTPRFVPGSV